MEQQQEYQQQSQANLIQTRKNENDFNTMRMRLDTHPLLDQIELFLRGARYTMKQDAAGTITTQKVKLGEQLANEKGIQEIMSWCSSVINTHVVQGNFPVDKHGYSRTYEKAIYDFRLAFADDLVLNIYDWGITDEQATGIIDKICFLTNSFLSRCIGDKERLSYAKTMESKETSVITPKGKLPIFK